MQGKHEGKGKPFVDQTQGDDLHRKTGTWMKLSRVIDRDNDLYHETVTNQKPEKWFTNAKNHFLNTVDTVLLKGKKRIKYYHHFPD